ncbi:MAG: ABC transporter ATP-binding protein, partial [Pseudomonadota bacterium]
ELINKLSNAGKTVFVTTHYMDEAEQCGRVALMRSGELIALGSPAELKTSSFPMPIFELTPPSKPQANWQEQVKKQGFIDELQTFGMRYHAMVNEPNDFEKYFHDHLPDFTYKKISPSLEDVFIRLVEGKDR